MGFSIASAFIMEIHRGQAWWWVLVEIYICFCQVVLGTLTIWDHSKFSAWAFWPPLCCVFRLQTPCVNWFVVINSQQFHFPSQLAPMFERVDFSFRPMIKNTIFPFYFYSEDVAIWGLGCMGWGGYLSDFSFWVELWLCLFFFQPCEIINAKSSCWFH